MASTFGLYRITGPADNPVASEVPSGGMSTFGSADELDPGTAWPIVTGTRSFWMTVAVFVHTPPSSAMAGLTVRLQAEAPPSGVLLKGARATAYRQATNTAELTEANHGGLAGAPVDMADTLVTPLSLGGALVEPETGWFGDPFVSQLTVALGFPAQRLVLPTARLEWDET